MRKLTVDQWMEEFIPIKNHLSDNASWQDENGDGIMFETFGIELGFVLGVAYANPQKIWTYVDGDDGTYIVDGYHLVNRIGYFITQNPSGDEFIEIEVDKYEDDEEDSEE